MRLPAAAWGVVKEAARHLLRRPVVGLVAYAHTPDGRVLLVRRGDTGEWAMPGGTLEWGETLRALVPRELDEEAGADVLGEPRLVGVYSAPHRDLRFHAVTVVVDALVSEPRRPPRNPLEILEARLFSPAALPATLAHGMADVLAAARAGELRWE